MRKIYFKQQNKRHRAFRRKLRKESTSAEKLLWVHLRKKGMGLLFRRQYSIGNYIVDFLCPPIRLIIEVDGEYHNSPEQQQKDRVRECVLRDMKFTIIRYTNKDVYNNFDWVLTDIKKHMALLKKKYHWKKDFWESDLGESGDCAPTCPSPL